jgi:hypothetical protein
MAAVKATLRQYWTPKDDEIVDAVELDDWRAALEDWPVDDIRRHLRMWVSQNPNKRPNHGHIAHSLKMERVLKWAESQPKAKEPERERASAEAVAGILAQVGFRPKVVPNE